MRSWFGGTRLLLVSLLCLTLCGQISAFEASSNCQFAVCASGCSNISFPANMPIFASPTDALANLSLTCAQSGAKLWLVPGGNFAATSQLPRALSRLYVETFALPNSSTPLKPAQLGYLSFHTDKKLVLSITRVHWLSNASSPKGCLGSPLKIVNKYLSLTLLHSQVDCQLSTTQFEVLNLLSSTLNCKASQHCFSSHYWLDESAFYLQSTTFSDDTTLNLRNSSRISLDSSNFLKPLLISISASSQISSFESTFHQELNISTVDDSTASSDTTIKLAQNLFWHQVNIVGANLGLSVFGNIFSGAITTTPERVHQNLFISPSCSISGSLSKNLFSNGTFYLGIPTPTQRASCSASSASLYEHLKIFHNSFGLHIRSDNFWEPSIDPAVSITFPSSYALPKELYRSTVIDITHNYWGSETGPYLCCNEGGKGGYPTQMLRPDFWCLESGCSSFSTTSLGHQCVESCCPQRMTKPELQVTITLAVLTPLASLVCLVVVIFEIKRRFTQLMFTDGRREEMLEMISKVLFISLGVSSASCFGVAAILIVLFRKFSEVPFAPRQERIQYAALLPMIVVMTLVVFQLFMNTILGIAVILRKRFPPFLKHSAGVLYTLSCIILAYDFVLCLVWFPFMIITPGTCSMEKTLSLVDLRGVEQMAEPSIIPVYLTSTLVPIVLVSALVVVPFQMLNSLLYHFEFASIHSSLEAALLKDLSNSPELHRRAFILRILSIIDLVLFVATLSFCILALFKPPTYPNLGKVWSIAFFGPSRWVSEVGAGILGVLSNIGIIWTTFFYNRVTVLTVLLATLGLSLLGAWPNLTIAWISYAISKDPKSFEFRGALMGVQAVSFTFGVATFIYLYRMRSNVIRDLPSAAISNLNAHLDSVWQSHSGNSVSTLGSDIWTTRRDSGDSHRNTQGGGKDDRYEENSDSVPLLSDIES